MQYEGTLYRPPSEARSLIIQVTIGCAHNRCTFCNMYREKKFRVREKEEIMRDLDECRAYYGPMVRRVFFADGDALVVRRSCCWSFWITSIKISRRWSGSPPTERPRTC